MKLSRRIVLRGIGGTVLALPFLEGLVPRTARAQLMEGETFAIFFRQANGVAQAQRNDEIGDEPERFWPSAAGALTTAALSGRALEVLAPVRDRILAVRGVDMQNYDFGDGHARGIMQLLTARPPDVNGAAGSSEAGGVSLDHVIGAELNTSGRESMFMYAGQAGGWLGGPCMSYRGRANRRAALHDPWTAYQALVGGTSGMTDEAERLFRERQQSVHDLVRDQMGRLLSRPELSTEDRRRLELHRDSIRDAEVALSCRMSSDEERTLMGAAPGFNSNDGTEVLETARLHMDIAALAVACGHTRSVAIQVGSGNDGSTRYRDPDTGMQMENYHYVSHRRSSHDSSGGIIAGADLLHHKIDRQFAATFLHLVQRLQAYTLGSGTLLDQGVAIWANDLSNGPPHGRTNCPFILAGSCGGYFRQGEMIDLPGDAPNIRQMLQTIGTAVGLSDPASFGDPTQPGGVIGALRAA